MTLNAAQSLQPTIQSILDKTSLKWIFVGGKGGVGKTSCSCGIAIQLSRCREKVLLISTDPAHNVSDAFDQKVGKIPTIIKGFKNLFAMEIDPTINLTEFELNCLGENEQAESETFRKIISDLLKNFPGMDEFISYTELFRLVNNMDYSTVVFDTAPTGHTLRLLSFPEMLEKSLEKVLGLKTYFGPLLTKLGGYVGLGGQPDQMAALLEEKMPLVRQIAARFRLASETTFVCVCAPDFLSLYETERLVQALAAQQIDVSTIIVNQLLFEEAGGECPICRSRARTQAKYLAEIEDLYDDRHVVRMPLLETEVRGVARVTEFSDYLVRPYTR